MFLPNGAQAELGDKLERYCLNPFHPKGKDKATVFKKRLGITLENKQILEEALLDSALHGEAVLRKSDRHGAYYNTRFSVQTVVGESWVLGCWIVRCGEDFPRLTNTYPVRKW